MIGSNAFSSHTFPYPVLLVSGSLPERLLFFSIVLCPYYSFLNSSYAILQSLASLLLEAWSFFLIPDPLPVDCCSLEQWIRDQLLSCAGRVFHKAFRITHNVCCRDLNYSGLFPAVTTSDPRSIGCFES